MKRADFVDFEKRARATMEYWCKHCRGEVRFEGDLISRPFGIEAGCQVERDDGFSHVVVGHAKGHESFYGLYNTGLTLIEGRDEYYEEVVFKASSPHLEHTLTRDNVIRDQGYERVMGAVDSLIHDELCREVYAQLDAELRRTLPSQTREFCYQAALWHAKNTPDLTGKVGKRAAFVTPRGEMITVARSRAAHREDLILVASTRSPLSDAAEAAELTVVLGPAEGAVPALAALLAPHGVRVQAASKAFALAVPARTEAETKRWAPLRTAARRLLDAWGASVSAVQLGHFDYPGSSIGDRIAITQQTLGELTPMDDVGEVGEGFLARSRVLAVNADHPTVKSLVRLAQKQPEVAAYILLKLFLLGHRLDEDVDGELAGATTKLRRESGR